VYLVGSIIRRTFDIVGRDVSQQYEENSVLFIHSNLALIKQSRYRPGVAQRVPGS
jgi:hypothetical protein